MTTAPEFIVPVVRDVLIELRAAREASRAMAAELGEVSRLLRAQAEGQAFGADAALLFALFAAFGSREFSTAEMLQLARRDDDGPRRCLLAALLCGMQKRNAGIRLGRLVGLPSSSGHVLRQTSNQDNVAVWQVLAFQDSQIVNLRGAAAP